MPNIFNYLKRREYVFRPAQALNRLRQDGKGITLEARGNFLHSATIPAHSNDNIKNVIFLTQCGFERMPLRAIN
jgi:hypothetical protein